MSSRKSEIASHTSTRTAVARLLLVHQKPASRLILKEILEAAGYRVDLASSTLEAVDYLETGEYALVLSDLDVERPGGGLPILAHARKMAYRPATALVCSRLVDETEGSLPELPCDETVLLISTDLLEFLEGVAELVSSRARKLLASSTEVHWGGHSAA